MCSVILIHSVIVLIYDRPKEVFSLSFDFGYSLKQIIDQMAIPKYQNISFFPNLHHANFFRLIFQNIRILMKTLFCLHNMKLCSSRPPKRDLLLACYEAGSRKSTAFFQLFQPIWKEFVH